MSFQVHLINYQSFCANPALRDASPTSYATLALAVAAIEALSGQNDSLNGAAWNSCIFDTNNMSAPTFPFQNTSIDD